MFEDLTPNTLAEIVGGIEPVELKGLALLRQSPPRSDWFPDGVDTDLLAEATIELVDYMADCRRTAERLARLGPVPITSVTVEAFSI